jgi:hypothetical protein
MSGPIRILFAIILAVSAILLYFAFAGVYAGVIITFVSLIAVFAMLLIGITVLGRRIVAHEQRMLSDTGKAVFINGYGDNELRRLEGLKEAQK